MTTLFPTPAVLLAQLAMSLEHDVLPGVDEHYRVVQVEAAVELLRNLAGRVEWRRGDLESDLLATDHAFEAITGDAGPVANAGSTEGSGDLFDALGASRARLGAEIDELYSNASPAKQVAAQTALGALLRHTVDAETERSRRAR